MKKALSFLFGALLGGIIGGGLVLLFTPYSGENLRVEITNYTQRIAGEVQAAAKQKRQELEEQLNKLRQPSTQA